MKKIWIYPLSIALCLVVLFSCTKEVTIYKQDVSPELPATSLNYSPGWSASFQTVLGEMDEFMSNQGVTDKGATLGRVLFYDKALSLNNKVACASCHLQDKGFADVSAKSEGFAGEFTPRNSMPIMNSFLQSNLFWDSRAESVDELVSEPILNHIEQGMESMNDLVIKLRNFDYYGPLFKDAFGSEAIDETKIVSAMSQFLNSMVTSNSKFDQGVANNFQNFTESEKLGKEIFFSEQTQCSGCHAGVNFSSPTNFLNLDVVENNNNDHFNSPYHETASTANIGLDLVYSDNGRANGQFKIPSLRNIALTAPYMHDGRYETLEEVVEFYSSQIKNHDKLDSKFKENGSVKKFNFSTAEKQGLIDFLNTLTDEDFVAAERFSSPFDY